ncbi:MAG: hypothetical protein EBS18_00570 [Actinobacteria bacterium]|nr:hypothetical protein [Actinomycetota bacterium]
MRSVMQLKKSAALALTILFFIPTNSYAISPMSYEDSLRITAPNDLASVEGNCPNKEAGWVANENRKPGIGEDIKQWRKINYGNPRGSALWISKSSATCGDSIQVFASKYNASRFDKSKRSIAVIRLGWYNGSGGHEYWSSKKTVFTEQAVPKPIGLLRTIESNWIPTTAFTIGKDWAPGFYLVVTKNRKNKIESIAPLIVRSILHDSTLALVHSTLTWQAYNSFGGYSLYRGIGNSDEERINNRSRTVSFDRPYTGSGAVHINRDAIALTQFLEKQGLDVDHYADTDIDTQPSVMKGYHGVIFGGHPEYVTRRIYDATFAARNTGTNLAFLGANNFYWQARTSSSPIGSNREVSVYRDEKEDVLFTGDFTKNDQSKDDTSTIRVETIWYKTPRNSVVFNAGLSLWSCEILESCLDANLSDVNRINLQSLTLQILNLWKIRGVAASLN